MTPDDFRRMALALKDAVEGAHMGHPDFRVNGRIFASLHADCRHGMVKLTPGQQQEMMASAPEAFTPESGAWGRQGCTRVLLASADAETLGEAMTCAWQNTVAEKAGRRSRAKPAPAPRRRTRRG